MPVMHAQRIDFGVNLPGINPDHSLSRGLAFCILMLGGEAVDIVTGLKVVYPSVTTPSHNGFGPGALLTINDASELNFGADPACKIVTSDGAGTGDFTCGVVANPSFSSGNWLFTQRVGGNQLRLAFNITKTDGVSAGRFTLYTYAGGFGGAHSSTSVIDGQTHALIGRRAAGLHSVWSDGANVTESADTNSTDVLAASQEFSIGGLAGNTDNNCANCVINIAFGWDRALADEEMAQVGIDPLCFLDFGVEDMAPWLFPFAAGGTTNTRLVNAGLLRGGMLVGGRLVA